MPLSKQQLSELRTMIQPMIDEALADSMREAVERAIKGEMREVHDFEHGTSYTYRSGPANYINKILAAQSGAGTRRAKELPHPAKVFVRLAFIAGAAQDGDHARSLAKTLDVEGEYRAAQSAGSAQDGGLLVRTETFDEIIPFLRPFAVVRRIQAREVQLEAGNLVAGKIKTGVSGGWVGEGREIPTSGLKTAAINLLARKLAIIVAMTRELSRFTAGGAEEAVFDDMMAEMGRVEDEGFLFGSGTEFEPLGITNRVASANKFNANATPNLTNVRADLRKAEQLLLDNNIPMLRPTWIMSPRSRLFLRDLSDADDRPVYGEEMARSGTINGIPFQQTNNIPNNLGAGTDESLIVLVDAAQVLIGDVPQLEVDRSDSATLTIDGSSKNLFTHDMRAIRVRRWLDFQLRYDTAAAVIQAVKWGA